MAENDINSMQAQLGLIGADGSMANSPSMSPVAIPTPQVRHPGEMSQQAAMAAQASMMQTIQASAVARPGGLANFNLGYGSGMGAPPMMGGYATPYQMNMAAMQGQMFNPFVAQAMGGMGGGFGPGGFNPSMLPNPAQFTDPMLGIYRQGFSGGVPRITPVPQMPFVPTPFTPTLPPPQFHGGFEYQYALAQQRADQVNAAMVSGPAALARGAVDMAGMSMGRGLGALAGAAVAGRMGGMLGGPLGMIAGAVLPEMLGVSGFVGDMVARANPLRGTALRGAQMGAITNDFVTAGPAVSMMGRGLSGAGAIDLGRRIDAMSMDLSLQRETGNQFSSQDYVNMTRAAGQSGMLDMAQTPERIASTMRQVAKQVKVFMQVANEPDMREAIRQMGQLSTMGVDIGDMSAFARRVRGSARAAGLSFQGGIAAGMPGAAMFQEMGLSAATGLEMGLGSLAMAQGAVRAGAFSRDQLAMLGGVQGIAQRDMMGMAATLRLPVLAASMSGYGPGGFALNGGNIRSLLTGGMGPAEMVRTGAGNISAAVAQGGPEAIAQFMVQEPELQNQIARTLGPQGMKAVELNTVLNQMKFLNLKGAEGFAGAAMSLGRTPEAARQLQLLASSPTAMAEIVRARRRADAESRGDAYRRNLETTPGFFERNFGDQYYAMSTGIGHLSAGVSQHFARAAEAGGVLAAGQSYVTRPRSLLVEDDAEDRIVAAAAENAGAYDLDRYSRGGYVSGTTAASMFQAVRRAEGGFLSYVESNALRRYAPFDQYVGEDTAKKFFALSGGARAFAAARNATAEQSFAAEEAFLGRFKDGSGQAVLEKFRSALKERAKSKIALFGENYNLSGDYQDLVRSALEGTGVSADAAGQELLTAAVGGLSGDATIDKILEASTIDPGGLKIAGALAQEDAANRLRRDLTDLVPGAKSRRAYAIAAGSSVMQNAFGLIGGGITGYVLNNTDIGRVSEDETGAFRKVMTASTDASGNFDKDLFAVAMLQGNPEKQAQYIEDVAKRTGDPRAARRLRYKASEILKNLDEGTRKNLSVFDASGSEFAAMGERLISDKATAALTEGFSALVTNADKYTKSGKLDLRALSQKDNIQDVLENSPVRKMLEEAQAAQDAGRTKEAEDKYRQATQFFYRTGRGIQVDTEAAGGMPTGKEEVTSAAITQELTRLQGQLAETFKNMPRAVTRWEQASEAVIKALGGDGPKMQNGTEPKKPGQL